MSQIISPEMPPQEMATVYGGEKVGHWSGGVVLLRAE
jgi:hypothetical protein